MDRLTLHHLALALLLVSVTNAQADMRCDRRLVDVGSSAYEVLSQCGEPAFQQLIREPVAAVYNTHFDVTGLREKHTREINQWSVEPQYREIERWIYYPGSGRLIQEVDIYNGEVIRMRTAGRTP